MVNLEFLPKICVQFLSETRVIAKPCMSETGRKHAHFVRPLTRKEGNLTWCGGIITKYRLYLLWFKGQEILARWFRYIQTRNRRLSCLIMQVDKGVSRLSLHSQADLVEVCLFSPFTTSDNENIINYVDISRMYQLPIDQPTYRDFPRRYPCGRKRRELLF